MYNLFIFFKASYTSELEYLPILFIISLRLIIFRSAFITLDSFKLLWQIHN
jgi:hypothetical protein